MTESEITHPLLWEIRVKKLKASQLFDDGEITTEEYQRSLDELFQRERGVCNEIDRHHFESANDPRKSFMKIIAAVICGFIIGFFLSPHVYSKIFGYENAEECALDNSTRMGAAMCFRLYERKDKDE